MDGKGSGPPAARPGGSSSLSAMGRVIREVNARSTGRRFGMSNVVRAGGRPGFVLRLSCKLDRALPLQPVNFRRVYIHRPRRGGGFYNWGHSGARQALALVAPCALVVGRVRIICVRIISMNLGVAGRLSRSCCQRDQNDCRTGRYFENCHRHFQTLSY